MEFAMTLGNELKMIALDLTDTSAERKFIKSTGQAPKYTNWAWSEPNNANNHGYENGEDYVALLTVNAYNPDYWNGNNPKGYWNDLPGKYETDVVCQLISPPLICTSPSQITANEILATGLTICEDWKLSVDLKLPSQPTPYWLNVFGVQVWSAIYGTPGAFIPAVWILKNQKEIYLHICNAVVDNHNYCFNTQTKWNTGNWINLKLSQINGIYEIRVDNKLQHKVTNTQPRTWNNVSVVIGNSYASKKGKYKPAVGEYQNFELDPCEKAATTTKSSINV